MTRTSKFTPKSPPGFFGPLAIIAPLVLTACASTPEIVQEVIEVTPPPVVQECYPIASLVQVVIPAVTKSGTSTVMIENPPEYHTDPKTGEVTVIQNPPVQTSTPYTVIMKPEEIYYTTQEGVTVTDICEHNTESASAG